MTYSTTGKYRGTTGTLIAGGGNLTFTRTDGLISKKQRIVISIPLRAIVNINVEGLVIKNLIVLVDGSVVPGVPRHEFTVSDPYSWMNAIRNQMAQNVPVPNQQNIPPPAPIQIIKEKETTTREVVKIRCQYCGCLFDEVIDKCPRCGGR